MDKFAGLETYLKRLETPVAVLSFDQINEIIGGKLPRSAYTYRAYWNPSVTHVLPSLIIRSGFRIFDVDLSKQRVILVRPGYKYEPEEKRSTQARVNAVSTVQFSDDVLMNLPPFPGEGILEQCLLANPFHHDEAAIIFKFCLIEHYSPFPKSKVAPERFAEAVLSIPDFDLRLSEGDISLVDTLQIQGIPYGTSSKYCQMINRFYYGKDDYIYLDEHRLASLPALFFDIRSERLPSYQDAGVYAFISNYLHRKYDEMKLSVVDRNFRVDRYLLSLKK